MLDMLMERENYCEDGFIAVRPHFSQSVGFVWRIYNFGIYKSMGNEHHGGGTYIKVLSQKIGRCSTGDKFA